MSEQETQLIVCEKNTQLPKTPMWMYVAAGIGEAKAMHAANKRAMPRKVYQFKIREFYFPVSEESEA